MLILVLFGKLYLFERNIKIRYPFHFALKNCFEIDLSINNSIKLLPSNKHNGPYVTYLLIAFSMLCKELPLKSSKYYYKTINHTVNKVVA